MMQEPDSMSRDNSSNGAWVGWPDFMRHAEAESNRYAQLMAELRNRDDAYHKTQLEIRDSVSSLHSRMDRVTVTLTQLSTDMAILTAQSAVVRFFLSLWRPKVLLAAVGAVVGSVGGWLASHSGVQGVQDSLMKFIGGNK